MQHYLKKMLDESRVVLAIRGHDHDGPEWEKVVNENVLGTLEALNIIRITGKQEIDGTYCFARIEIINRTVLEEVTKKVLPQSDVDLTEPFFLK